MKVGETATLELTPQQAEIITVAQQMADRLTLSLRCAGRYAGSHYRGGGLSRLRQWQARHDQIDQAGRSFRSGSKEMTSGAALPAISGKRSTAHPGRRDVDAHGEHRPSGNSGALAGGQMVDGADVASSSASQTRQARPQQVGRHRPARRCLRHPGRQSRGGRRGDPHGAPHLSVRQVGRPDEHLRLRPQWRADRQPRPCGRARHRRPRGLHQALHTDFRHQGRTDQRQRRPDRHGRHPARCGPRGADRQHLRARR